MFPAAEAILRLLYPEDCGLCRTPLSLDCRHLCPNCRDEVRSRRHNPLSMIQTDMTGQLDQIWVLFPFSGPVRELLHHIKFHGGGHRLHAFNDDFRDFALLIGGERTYDAVVPIPSDLERLLERELNPAEEIAAEMASLLNLPLQSRWLSRRGGTGTQHSRNERQRRIQLQGAFSCRSSAGLTGRRILLIDDIRTTGATTSEAARVLREKGAASVDLFALAQTEKNPERVGIESP